MASKHSSYNLRLCNTNLSYGFTSYTHKQYPLKLTCYIPSCAFLEALITLAPHSKDSVMTVYLKALHDPDSTPYLLSIFVLIASTAVKHQL